MVRHTLTISVAALALLSCTNSMDMQGHDPVEYYKEHPIANRVETQNASQTVRFDKGQNRLSKDMMATLNSGLRAASPQAAESVQVQLPQKQMKNSERKEHLAKALRRMGYSSAIMMFEPSASLEADEAKIDVTYAVVVSPRCPDWRRSPTHNYSNIMHPNMGCASTTNLGLMVADPHDLEGGSGTSGGGDATRMGVVFDKLRKNEKVDQEPAITETSSSSTQ